MTPPFCVVWFAKKYLAVYSTNLRIKKGYLATPQVPLMSNVLHMKNICLSRLFSYAYKKFCKSFPFNNKTKQCLYYMKKRD